MNTAYIDAFHLNIIELQDFLCFVKVRNAYVVLYCLSVILILFDLVNLFVT